MQRRAHQRNKKSRKKTSAPDNNSRRVLPHSLVSCINRCRVYKNKTKTKKNLSTCPKIMRVVGRGFVVCVVVALPSPSFPQSSGSSQSRPTIDRPDIRSTHGDLERSRSSLPDAATACGICGFLPSLRLSLRCPPPVIIG